MSRHISRYIFLAFDGLVWREQTRGADAAAPCGFRFTEAESGSVRRLRWRWFDATDEVDPRWPDAVVYREVETPPYYDPASAVCTEPNQALASKGPGRLA